MKSRIFLFVRIITMSAFAATIKANADVTPSSLDAEVSPGSGEDDNLSELVAVPNNPTLEGTSVYCGVDFQNDEGNSLRFQNIWIDIADGTPPQVSCLEGVNPAGKTLKANTTNEEGSFSWQRMITWILIHRFLSGIQEIMLVR